MPQNPYQHTSPSDFIRPIETGRLVLRAMTNNDATDFLAIAGDGYTAYWAGMEPLKNLDEAIEMIRIGNRIPSEPMYAITIKGSDKVIGAVEVSDWFDSEANSVFTIGYLMSPEETKRGYASEAVKAVCRGLFERGNVDRIMLEIRKDNIPSRRVARKCGFVQNAKQKKWSLNHFGHPLDEFFLTKDAFMETISIPA